MNKSLLRLWHNLALQQVPDVYLLPGMIPLAFLEGVTAGNGDTCAVRVERQQRYRRGALGHDGKLLLVRGVPGNYHPVGAAGGEGAVDRVEGDCVHRVYRLADPMALEGVLLACGGTFVE